MKVDIKVRCIIKLIPHFRVTFKRSGKYWLKYSINLDWLIFNIDIDNF